MSTSILTARSTATPTTWARAGLLGGLAAGIVFAMFEMLMALLLNGSGAVFMPLRMIGAIALGSSALMPSSSLLTAGGAGLVIHMLLSMLYGLVVAGVLALAPSLSRTRVSTVVAASVAGFGLWILNFFILAGLFGWSWFPDSQNVVVQFVAHTVMFGSVLGLVVDRLAFRGSR